MRGPRSKGGANRFAASVPGHVARGLPLDLVNPLGLQCHWDEEPNQANWQNL